jgi:CRISPR-associated exonuclease Cas4
LLVLIGFLFLSGVLLLWISTRQRRAAGIPAGRVIYSDPGFWGKVEEPLYDPTFNLSGKPDYLIERGSTIIPVEIKSSRLRTAPFDSHIFQLAAYCLLVHRIFGKKPPYGILHYSNRDIAIDYTPELEKSIIELVRDIRSNERRRGLDRSHQSSNRCHRCGYNSICDQALSS